MKKKSIYDVPVVSFKEAFDWATNKGAQTDPLTIPTLVGKSRAELSVIGENIIMVRRGNNNNVARYTITESMWKTFINKYSELTLEQKTSKYIGSRYHEFGCTNYTFWPSILAICKAVNSK